MLPRADLNGNRPPATVAPPTPATSSTDARQEVFRRLTQIDIGRELRATVVSKLEDGTHLVRVADTQARMALPVGTRVGDQLNLVFIAREPRPTFLLTGQSGSFNASFSSAARLIDHLLQSASRDGTAPLRGSTPLLARAGIGVAQLAGRLQQALSASGLFYESHLQDWISGSRTLAELRREPQARFGAQATAPSAATDTPELTRLAAAIKALGNDNPALLRLIQAARPQAQDAHNVDAQLLARAQGPLPELDPELARMLQQQLNALEQQQIRWQGQLWPGQPLDWEITEERSQHEPENREASTWSSIVRFELPHLGPVEAVLSLNGARVQVQVRADSDDAVATLREFAPLLRQALDAAGAPLDMFQAARERSDAG